MRNAKKASLTIELDGQEKGLEVKVNSNGDLGIILFGLGVAVERLEKEYDVPYESLMAGIENGYQSSVKKSEAENA